MSFGLCTAPAIFKELMRTVIESFDKFTVAYLEYILIYSRTLDELLVIFKGCLTD